jgi:hypothetical protein
MGNTYIFLRSGHDGSSRADTDHKNWEVYFLLQLPNGKLNLMVLKSRISSVVSMCPSNLTNVTLSKRTEAKCKHLNVNLPEPSFITFEVKNSGKTKRDNLFHIQRALGHIAGNI